MIGIDGKGGLGAGPADPGRRLIRRGGPCGRPLGLITGAHEGRPYES
jgi:hypothetical protein